MALVARQRLSLAIAAFVGMAVTIAPVYVIPLPLFLKAVSQEFGWGRATIPSAAGFAVFFSVIMFAIVGRILDRWGPRPVLLPGYIFFGGAVMAMSQLNGSIGQLMCLSALISAFGSLPTGIAFARVISGAFQKNRGAVLGICLGGGAGVGGALVPPFAQWLMEHFGWRGAYLGLGLLPILIGFPTVYFLLRGPGLHGMQQSSSPAFGASLRDALRDRNSWLLLAAVFLSCGVINGVTVHLGAMLSDRGFTPYVATAALSTYAFMMAGGQSVVGFLLDRVPTPRVALPIFAAVLVGVLLIHFTSSLPLVFLAAVLIGLGTGAEYGLFPYLIARLFGLRNFGQIYGAVYIAAALSYGAGPVVMGRMFDAVGSYRLALIGFEAAMVLAIILMGSLRRYVYAPDGTRMPVASMP
jgi:MFS family permease